MYGSKKIWDFFGTRRPWGGGPVPSESGTHLGDSFNLEPKIAPNRPKSSKVAQNRPDLSKFLVSLLIRLRSGHLPESARIRPNPTLHRIRPNPESATKEELDLKKP